MEIQTSLNDEIEMEEVLAIYKANKWSSAKKPDQLFAALQNSDGLVTARHNGELIGLGNAISDGYLVVNYPHLLVLPEYQKKGIGRQMVLALQEKYKNYHQQVLIADGKATNFYKGVGFVQAGNTEPMWIYEGIDH
jgi:GNAT superfamily N-acetyltransferase